MAFFFINEFIVKKKSAYSEHVLLLFSALVYLNQVIFKTCT